jgi:hypothetical protein
MARTTRTSCAAALLALAAACSGGGPAFPESIAFERQPLVKATSWARDQMAGVVYVPPGQTLPQASRQVGAIISGDHLSAAALHEWVRDQVRRSATPHFHASEAADESCRVARSHDRTYLALEVCKTGVARAVCVESDEALADDVLATCLNASGCFADLCDARWVAHREALDLLAADILTIR